MYFSQQHYALCMLFLTVTTIQNKVSTYVLTPLSFGRPLSVEFFKPVTKKKQTEMERDKFLLFFTLNSSIWVTYENMHCLRWLFPSWHIVFNLLHFPNIVYSQGKDVRRCKSNRRFRTTVRHNVKGW